MMTKMKLIFREWTTLFYGVTVCFMMTVFSSTCTAQSIQDNLFAENRLAAWCIVPFDSKQRNPEERATMLRNLGITKLAYDWREEDISRFDEEWNALQKNGIDLFAFWLPSNADPANEQHIEQVFDFLERNQIKTQLWYLPGWFTGFENIVPGFKEMTRKEQIEAISKPVQYIAERALKIGCTVGLYNHGGWFGEPENQIAIIEYLNMPNVGMVFNFQHAKQDLNRFWEFYPKMEPHLLCVNLVGVENGNPAKVVALGEGNIEYGVIQQLLESGYSGPISIQNHHADRDAEEGLIGERAGLMKIMDVLQK